MNNIPDDLKPKRVNENTVEFLGIQLVSTPLDTTMTTKTTVAPPEKLAKVKLIGNNGNAFAIMGACQRAGRKAGYTNEQMTAYMNESTSGDYDNLLCTAMKWFNVS